MKLYSIAIFVSTLLVLHTATALIAGAGLRYIRRSLEDVHKYRIRDSVPNSENVKSANPSNTGNADVAPQVTDKIKPQRLDSTPQESMQPENPLSDNSLAHPEEMLDDTNDIPGDSAGTGTIPQVAQNTLPTDADYPKRRGDRPAFTDSEYPEDVEQVPPTSEVSQTPVFKRLKMYAGLISILANIARIPETVALQIDSVISGLQKTYPANTNVGAYMMGTRFLLRNPRALQPFDLLDQAGFRRLPDLVSSMPSVFLPILNAMDRLWEVIVRRGAVVAQRFAGAMQRITARATRSLAGINFARSMDSYSMSVPNLIDLVLKGRLASKLDEVFAYLQRGIRSGISNVGSVFSASNPMNNPDSAMNYPVSANDSPRNRPPAYRMRSNPRFSALRNYYRPSRYFDN